MKRSILALASGAFILGAAEFVMMGILPQTATAMHVSIPAAGHYISAYAIGVCVGTLILVFGRKVPPKHLIILFMAIALVGNTLSAVSFCSPMLLVARFISGLPHGAFFGTATLIAKTLADKGKEAQSVSMMCCIYDSACNLDIGSISICTRTDTGCSVCTNCCYVCIF